MCGRFRQYLSWEDLERVAGLLASGFGNPVRHCFPKSGAAVVAATPKVLCLSHE
jgi:hypothetical protein